MQRDNLVCCFCVEDVQGPPQNALRESVALNCVKLYVRVVQKEWLVASDVLWVADYVERGRAIFRGLLSAAHTCV